MSSTMRTEELGSGWWNPWWHNQHSLDSRSENATNQAKVKWQAPWTIDSYKNY